MMRLIDADDPILRGRLYTYTRYSGIDEAPNEHAEQELDFVPTVEERKRGKWIISELQDEEDVINDNYCFECSVCRCSDIHARTARVSYCWNCGAKMEEDDEIN